MILFPKRRFAWLGLCLILVACAPPTVRYQTIALNQLPGWADHPADELRLTLETFCEKPPAAERPAWEAWCTQLTDLETADLKGFLANTLEVRELKLPAKYTKFTGYYTPDIVGSLVPTPEYSVPLRGKPADLIRVDLQQFNIESSQRYLVGRIEYDQLTPYPARAEIEAKGGGDVIAWLADPVDKFFLQIQGSGHLVLPDGERKTIGFAGANGRTYTPIGRVLLQQEELALPVSMQSIREWLEANPTRRDEIFNHNERYIFFELRDGPAHGTYTEPLLENVTLAVDPTTTALGTLVYVATDITMTSEAFQRLMVAHDTGSAIKGPVRGDIYFGGGARAAALAGKQNSTGRLFQFMLKERPDNGHTKVSK